jgi:DNA mismatch repair protein MutL
MKKIRILSDFEIACIAAGEVIENPSSIIKELIENSIDAGATEIKIFFTQGGIEEIIIIDDGCGISPEDLSLVFLPHATSKLLNIDELYLKNNIFFGFRGEALSAISGVSLVTVISRERDAESGFSITADHGRLFDIEPVASNIGTTVIVKNLFEKIPVRKKYLNSVKNQEKNIIYMITGLVLSHPEIHFIIYKDSKLYKEYKPVLDFIARSYQIASGEKDRYIIVRHEDIYFKLEGIISFYEYGYYDRSKIFILANHRLIKQYKITQSCLKAYHSDNFAKKYPELFLSITVSPDQIDVNVHPRKEEVLFLYQKKIEQLLTEVLIKAFDKRTQDIFNISLFSNSPVSNNEKILELEKKQHAAVNNLNEEDTYNISKNFHKENIQFPYSQLDYERKNKQYDLGLLRLKEESSKNIDLISLEKTDKKNDDFIIDNSKYSILSKNIDNAINNFDLKNDIHFKENNANHSATQGLLFEKASSLTYLGIFANTYIILLDGDSILFIDQHALHEKILYEDYINNFREKKNIAIQPLIFEEKIRISNEEKNLFLINESVFNSLGITYYISSDYLFIKTYPINLLKFSISDMMFNFLASLYTISHLSFEEKQDKVLHEMAALYGCKNAIKGGDVLSREEIDLLLQSISKMKSGSFCPHGRPIYYQMHLNHLHSLFKRI